MKRDNVGGSVAGGFDCVPWPSGRQGAAPAVRRNRADRRRISRITVAAFLALSCTILVAADARAQVCSFVNDCGDVDQSGAVVTTDAQRVLRKAVGQDVTLVCECSDGGNTCAEDLAECLARPDCGNGTVEAGEECDVGNLDGASCGLVGFEGGTMRCDTGCQLDPSDCYSDRFDTSGPTILDNETGLEWEKKDAGNGVQNLTNPHDSDNLYTWADFLSVPNGSAFDDFLARLNAPIGPGVDVPAVLSEGFGPTDTGCYAGHCDWRLPTADELQSIMQGKAPNCNLNPCMYPDFAPGVEGLYWTLSTTLTLPNNAWAGNPANGSFVSTQKTLTARARAVRGGN